MVRCTVLTVAMLVAASCSGAGDEAVLSTTTGPTTTIANETGNPSDGDCSQPQDLEPDDDGFLEARLDMVTEQIEARGLDDPLVLDAMRTVPRHRFVPDDMVEFAYTDGPLPIGYGQTISQPQIVALMTQLLELKPCDKVLEIGTGSGYQAAVLSQLGVEVYTIEIVPELAIGAGTTLAELGYSAAVRQGDGYVGWEENGPFDAIIVTAAPDHVPQPLVNQLADGGRLVIPIGPVGAVQTMWQFTVDNEGQLIGENFGAVRFVPFTRDE